MRRIIVHGLRLEFRDFVTFVQVWPTQPTIEGFKNFLANQEEIDKQMSGALIKNDEKILFTDKKKHWFKWHNGRELKGDVDK